MSQEKQNQLGVKNTLNQELLSGAEIVLRALNDQNVDTIFGYPGGAVLPLYDELYQQNSIRHILVRHEQGASHAAEGYARSTGKVGVLLVTSGPGATNVVTGLTDALLDSVPLVCFCGQVAIPLIGTDAFQECDTTGITRACTKHNYLVRHVDDLARIVHEAFYIARSGRPGPVVIDLPKDVQFAKGKYLPPLNVTHKTYHPTVKAEDANIQAIAKLMVLAKKPVIYAGGGVVNSGLDACDKLNQLVALTNFPTTLTLMGLGAMPASRAEFLGMVGMHGTYQANMAMHQCDLLINIGARFDDRVTGKLDLFSPNSKKIHIDIDPSSINKIVQIDISAVGDVNIVLEQLLDCLKNKKLPTKATLAPWWQQIQGWRNMRCLDFTQEEAGIIKPQHAVQRLYELTKSYDPYITTEVGQHQMWAAQHFPFEKPCHWMTSGGLGTMGYGLPAAIGVQIAYPDALVIDIAGEASILMNIQELTTAVQYKTPVKIFILNNEYMGMVRQWQELLHENRYSHSYSDSLPDFVKLAEAYHACGLRANHVGELDDVITEMLKTPHPVLVDVRVEKSENCYPMIPSGAGHNEMLLSPDNCEDAVSEEGRILV